uniref:Uncharacterized protein n=1 Tax=Anopheles atroparvus TaxID=41427 RepID=A0A182J4P1_ANOAO
MEKEEIWIPSVQSSPAFCRICVLADDEDIKLINQPMNEHDGTNSLQMMLEKLFPSVFSDEQLRSDECMNWPTRICEDCKRKVKDAYGLYELCVASTERLRKMLSEECVPSAGLGSESHTDSLLWTPVEDGIKEENIPEVLNGPPRSPNLETSAQGLIKSEEAPEISRNSQEIPRRTTRKRTCTKAPIKSCVESGHSKLNLSVIAVENRQQDDEMCPSRQAKHNKPPKERCKPRQENTGKQQTNSAESKETDKPKTKIDLYRCQLCDSPTYSCPTELTEHLKTEHPEQIRFCAQCPKVFMGEQAFQHHQYCHATGRSYFCMFCDKGFRKQNLLDSHIRTHTKRGDFLCSLCGKEFTKNTNLRQHAKIKHSGEKPWACTLCPSRFTTKGERPFACDVCKMRFVSNYMLKRHMLTHTGEKPFKCTYCERSFAQSNDMVKHIRTHVGDNLYKCDRCDASYRLLSELRNHYTEHYRVGDGGADGSALAEDGNIRFTTTYIMKLRMEKEKAETESSRAVEFSSSL